MTHKHNGGPAFPILNNKIGYHADIRQEWYGVTVRDYFAAKALSSLIAVIYQVGETTDKEGGPITEDTLAVQAYHFADAMLKAREAV